MSETTSQNLQKLGLNEKEAACYLALLHLGRGKIAEIAKRAGLKRPTTYLVVEELVKKGLVEPQPQGKKIVYAATDPGNILDDLRAKEKIAQEVLGPLKTLYIQASGLQRLGSRVNFYEGKQGLWRIYQEMCREGELFAIFSAEKYFQVFTDTENKQFFRVKSKYGHLQA